MLVLMGLEGGAGVGPALAKKAPVGLSNAEGGHAGQASSSGFLRASTSSSNARTHREQPSAASGALDRSRTTGAESRAAMASQRYTGTPNTRVRPSTSSVESY